MTNQPATMLQTILHLLDEMQAIDVTAIDVSKQTTITDHMIICSGRSSRHVKAIAQDLMEKLKAQGTPAVSNHGLEHGEWALIDFGYCVIHVMVPDSRAYYNIEGLWQE